MACGPGLEDTIQPIESFANVKLCVLDLHWLYRFITALDTSCGVIVVMSSCCDFTGPVRMWPLN